MRAITCLPFSPLTQPTSQNLQKKIMFPVTLSKTTLTLQFSDEKILFTSLTSRTLVNPHQIEPNGLRPRVGEDGGSKVGKE